MHIRSRAIKLLKSKVFKISDFGIFSYIIKYLVDMTHLSMQFIIVSYMPYAHGLKVIIKYF